MPGFAGVVLRDQQCSLLTCHALVDRGSSGRHALLTKTAAVQGLSGSAQRYVRFLLASTAGYKEAMLHQDGSLHCLEPSHQRSAAQPPAPQDLHIHFMSHCEHHMLPFHGQASVAVDIS